MTAEAGKKSTALAPVRDAGTLAPTGLRLGSFDEAWKLAETLAGAEGFVPKAMVGKPASVLAAIATGAEMGIGPMEALRNLFVIEGRIGMDASYILARVHQFGIKTRWLTESTDREKASLEFTRANGEKHVATFTWEMAKQAGLTGKANTWGKYPDQMLRRRTITMGVRDFCPEVTNGPIYSRDEIADIDPGPESTPVARLEPRPQPAANDQPKSAPREVESIDGEIVAVPENFAACTTRAELYAFCTANRDVLSAFKNGKRKTAIDKCLDAAGRCGVDEPEALGWAGLADEAPPPTE